MKTRVIMSVLAVIVASAGMSIWFWLTRFNLPATNHNAASVSELQGARNNSRQPSSNQGEVTVGQTSLADSETKVVVQDARSGGQAIPSPFPSQLKELLSRADYSPRSPRDVPKLDSQSEQALLDLYSGTDDPGERYKLIKILVFGESTLAAPLIWRALMDDFSGKNLTRSESAKWIELPVLLGIVAAKDNHALDQLIRATSAGFWESVELWTWEDGTPERPSALRGRCIFGLAVSMHPRAQAILDGLRDDPARAAAMELEGALVDAAWIQDLIKEKGLNEAIHILYGPEPVRQFAKWLRSTSNGVWWVEWRQEAIQQSAAR